MATRSIISFLLAGPGVVMLSSCQLPVGLVVTQLNDGRIVIASDVDSGTPPCISSAGIAPFVGENVEEGASLWWAGQDSDRDGCTNKIVYPEIPAHYKGEFVKPLEPGKRYEVAISGVGYSITTTIVRRGRQ